MMTLSHTLSLKRCVLILLSFFVCVSGSSRGNERFGIALEPVQAATTELSGTILDEKGAVIPGVDVTVTNIDNGLQREKTTNGAGYFVFSQLPPGHYNARATRQGFEALEHKNIVLNVNSPLALRLQLRVGRISESVTVDTNSLIQTESAAVRTVIDRQFVENLPLNGGSFSTLIELTPGSVLTKTQGQYSVNGQRTNANYFMVDGVSANVGIDTGVAITNTAGGTIPAFSALGTTSNLVSMDALQEFTIQTSTYAAEFGRNPGAQVATISRSGTNHFHGTAFEYFRNDALDANDWFANSRGLENPALRQNDFGGVLGGPIVRNRTFFFLSYEGLRLREPHVGITAVPGLSERAAAPARMQPFLKALPLPNGANLGDGLAEFDAGYSNPSSLDATSLRLDHTFNSKLTLFGRFNYAPSDGYQRGGTSQSQTTSLNNSYSVQFKTVTVTIGSTQIVSSNITNDIRANYSRNSGGNIWYIDSFGGAIPPPDSVLFPAFASSADSVFDFIIGEDIGYLVGKNARNLQRQINVVDNLAIVKSSHQLKFGIDWRGLSPVLDSSEYFQIAAFNNVARAVAGIADFVSVSGKSGRATTNVNQFSAYAQDNWKVGKWLTLNYGIRWEYNPAASISETNPPIIAVGRLEDPSTLRLAPPGMSWNTNHNNFAPRIGVAYQFSQKPGREAALRGGFGVFYDTAGRLAGSVLGGTASSTNFLGGVSFPLTLAQATPLPPTTPTPPYPAFEIGLKQPRTYEWNATIEQSLGRNQTISASYVGAAGRNLLRLERLLNPTPEFASVNGVTNLATSDYHALQLQYRRRLSRGLQALASYTWSHSIDISSNDTFLNPPNSKLNPENDRGSSDFDVRHSLSAGVTYDLPGPSATSLASKILRHWSLEALFRTHTALPVNIITGRAFLGGRSTQRPDLIPGVPLYLDDPNVAGSRRINRAAFSIPPSTRQGTLGRNALRGFPVTQLDFALHRQFSLNERWTLQLRAEFFNTLNHPNFADPESNLSEGSLFGQSITMLGRSLGGLNPLYQIGGPRSIQLALKLNY